MLPVETNIKAPLLLFFPSLTVGSAVGTQALTSARARRMCSRIYQNTQTSRHPTLPIAAVSGLLRWRQQYCSCRFQRLTFNFLHEHPCPFCVSTSLPSSPSPLISLSVAFLSPSSPPRRLLRVDAPSHENRRKSQPTNAAPADETFEACQIVATVLCSVAVLFFTVAFCRPYDAGRTSSKSLGLVGGVFMSLFTFFQMVSFLFQIKSIQECEWGAREGTRQTYVRILCADRRGFELLGEKEIAVG